MPAKHPPIAGTLASFAECGRPVFIVCDNCRRFIRADLPEIARSVGWRAMALEVGPRLRCEKCHHRGGRITLDRPPGRPG